MRNARFRLISKQTGEQSGKTTEDGIRFVLSTDEVDLAGDVVVQSGISLAREPLPAQIDHGGGMFDLIGQWHDFQTGAHETTAVLKLLKRGVSRAADLVRDLYQEGIQLAASIGFVPDWDAYELIRDEKNEYVTGIKWLKSTLTEASVIVTPANPSALARAKSLAGGVSVRQPPQDARAEILKRLQGTVVPKAAAPSTTPARVNTMNIAEQIRAAEVALNALRDRALAATKSLVDCDETARTGLLSELDTLNANVAEQERTLATLKRTEQTLAARATPVDAPAIIHAEPRVTKEQRKNLIVRAGLLTFEAYAKRVPLAQVLEERYGRDPLAEATKAVALFLQVKAAQNPAMTSVPEWAGALVRDGYGAFLEDLSAVSIVAKLPLEREEFAGFNSITVAARATSPSQDPNLAAAFRGEGDPIRVGSVGLTSKKLTPKTMGIIGTFTMELFRRSTPNIETKIEDWMREDTAYKLDTIFLGAVPGTPIQPAGIQAGINPADTAASTGTSAAQITADIKARLGRMASLGLGKRPVWVMNPIRAIGLALSRDATGALSFPSMSGPNPSLAGVPVVTSVTVPQDVVFLVDAAWISFAGDAPEFMGTEVATIHEEYNQADVKPIIGGVAGTPEPAQPVRSLYQTFSGALRAIWQVDWLVLRAGAVQTITGVAW